MSPRIRIAYLLGFILLHACSGDKNIIPESPEPAFTPSLRIQTLWHRDYLATSDSDYAYIGLQADVDRLFAADSLGKVIAIDSNSGHLAWQAELGRELSAAVGRGDRMLYGVDRNGDVIALDKEDGAINWHYRLQNTSVTAPIYRSGLVFIRTIDGTITALDAENGEWQWSYRHLNPALTLHRSSAPLPYQQSLIVGYPSGTIAGINRNNGQLQWSTTVSTPKGQSDIEQLADIVANPLIQGNLLLVAAYQGEIVAIDLSRQSVRWRTQISTYKNIASSSVYPLIVIDEEDIIHALNLDTGETEWRQDTLRGRGLTPAAYLQGNLLVGDRHGVIYLLRPDDGALQAKKRIARKAFIADIATSGRRDIAYLLSESGKISAVTINPH